MIKTPEEQASAITKGWQSVKVDFEWTGPLSQRPLASGLHIGGDMVSGVTEMIADAIREAVAAEREAIMKVTERLLRAYELGNHTCDDYKGGVKGALQTIIGHIRKRGNA